MFKNLSAPGLGVTGRQSELIELALTYGFRGFDIDFADFAKRSAKAGTDYARRFIASAEIQVGGFALPTRWQEDEATYKSDLQKLKEAVQYAEAIDIATAWTDVAGGSDSLAYHVNFELHRARLAEIANVLGGAGIRLAIGFTPAAAGGPEYQYSFIRRADELVKLLQSINSPHAGLGLDTWSWTAGGGDLKMLKALGAAKIVSVRVADRPAEAAAGDASPADRLLPGETGEVDNVQILRFLLDENFKGPVTAYPHGASFSGMTRDAIVQRAAAALDELWGALGLESSTKQTLVAAAAPVSGANDQGQA